MRLFYKKHIGKQHDEALMVLLMKNNDHLALTELYNRYAQKLLGYFIKMFKGDVEKSQDFLQDLFVKIMDKKHLFDPNKKFYTWVFTIASNMCKTEFRKQTELDVLSYELVSENLQILPDNLLDKKIFKRILKQSIHTLTYTHKVVFILKFNEKFSLKEIAEITETSVGTVKSRLFYATKAITSQLKEYNPKENSDFFKIK